MQSFPQGIYMPMNLRMDGAIVRRRRYREARRQALLNNPFFFQSPAPAGIGMTLYPHLQQYIPSQPFAGCGGPYVQTQPNPLPPLPPPTIAPQHVRCTPSVQRHFSAGIQAMLSEPSKAPLKPATALDHQHIPQNDKKRKHVPALEQESTGRNAALTPVKEEEAESSGSDGKRGKGPLPLSNKPKRRTRLPTEKRKAQNRYNQRAFRARREERIRELEASRDLTDQMSVAQQAEIHGLRQMVGDLAKELNFSNDLKEHGLEKAKSVQEQVSRHNGKSGRIYEEGIFALPEHPVYQSTSASDNSDWEAPSLASCGSNSSVSSFSSLSSATGKQSYPDIKVANAMHASSAESAQPLLHYDTPPPLYSTFQEQIEGVPALNLDPVFGVPSPLKLSDFQFMMDDFSNDSVQNFSTAALSPGNWYRYLSTDALR